MYPQQIIWVMSPHSDDLHMRKIVQNSRIDAKLLWTASSNTLTPFYGSHWAAS